MYFANSQSKILHYAGCHHIDRICDINFAGFDYIEDARSEGYRLCKCCDPMIRKIQPLDNDMMRYCKSRAISYQVINGELRVLTPFSEWKAYIGNNSKYDLYHKNTRGRINDYHLQLKGMKSPMAILKYVDGHDNFRLDNPLPKEQKKTKSKPRKGTKRYRKEMRKAEAAKKRYDVKRVLDLIDSLSMA